MSIKVIKPASSHLKGPDKYRGECSRCSCVIECAKEDITYEDRPCADGFVLCPTENCGYHIVPRLVVMRAERDVDREAERFSHGGAGRGRD